MDIKYVGGEAYESLLEAMTVQHEEVMQAKRKEETDKAAALNVSPRTKSSVAELPPTPPRMNPVQRTLFGASAADAAPAQKRRRAAQPAPKGA